MSFAAEKDRGRQSPIPIYVRLLCFGSGANYPDVTFFQLLYQSNKIRHTGNRNILERAGRDLCDDTRQTNGPPLSNEYSMNTGTFGIAIEIRSRRALS